MTTRTRNILIVAGGALLLIGVIVFLLLRPKKPAAPGEALPDGTPASSFGDAPAPLPSPLAPEPTKAEPGQTAAIQMAELFAERYGSYSNQGEYQNLRDLLPVMTASYRAETEAILAKPNPPAASYEGVTSVKVSTQTHSYNEAAGRAEMSVTLQQEKTVGGAAPVAGYRVLRVTLERIGQDWRIDSARWEN